MENLIFNKKIKNTKIAVAMSGGVDSSVAAVMLKKLGYDVIGITMKLYNNSDKVNSNKSCCAGIDINDAKKVAEEYNFPHYIIDLQNNFFNNVVDDFIETYSKGETPIPCIRCNQTVKFIDMLNAAKRMNADALVTGHYARRIGSLNNAKLYRAKDKDKDQTYFLFATTKDQLNYLRFPLGDYTKVEVRKIANKFSLKVQDKNDSQDICFVTNNSYNDLITKLKPESLIEGNIVDVNKRVIGSHSGIINYTVGQRRKIGIGGNVDPLYVIRIDSDRNEIVVGNKNDLKKNKVIVKNINWISEITNQPIKCSAKIKSDQKPQKGEIKFYSNNSIEFVFEEPQIYIAPGQACVFYKGDEVLGGGWINKEKIA